jgi:poly(A) polymerase
LSGAGGQGPLTAAREALAGEEGVWIVGGAVRDALLGRPTKDLDLAVAGDVREAAKRLARHVRGPAFELSEDFGAWRVIGPERAWEADLSPLRGATIEEDLAHRDFTVNAMAAPLRDGGEGSAALWHPLTGRAAGTTPKAATDPGGPLIDPFGGARDLEAKILRAVGPRSFADDPLRVLRLARVGCELGLRPDEPTLAGAQAHAAGLTRVAPERIFAELKRVVSAADALGGLDLMERTGALEVVLPELQALSGVEQTVYHHRDAYGHTLEVLEQAIALETGAAATLGDDLGARVQELLTRPLADDLTRGQALRFGALLHDAAKPLTQTPNPKGGYGFPGHDRVGAGLVDEILARLRTSVDLRRHVADLTRHHLRPGFLVHHRPLAPRTVYGYLRATEPVEVDTLLLSVADRCATRGRKADEAIAKHLELVRELLPPALDWHDHGAPPPLVRGGDLARELGLTPGPELGRLLAELAEAQYAREIASRDDAVTLARRLRSGDLT